jgi:phosphoribosylanthranilate isomerase
MAQAKIKICGITNLSDARLALTLGADLLGFNFYRPSPRYIEPARAAEIIGQLPADAITVGVFVNAGVEGVQAVLAEIAAAGKAASHKSLSAIPRLPSGAEGTAGSKAPPCTLHMAQLHGDESNAGCQAVRGLGLGVIKALRVRAPADLARLGSYDVDAVLLDAFHEELYGGTGHRFDWGWLRQAPAAKVFLAGGITPDNMAEALAAGTYGVDVCSGVESRPGVKDPDKLHALFDRIRGYHG